MSLEDTHVTLAHGNGGRLMRELIEELFVPLLGNPELDIDADAACLGSPRGELMMTTDGFTVQPLEYPGGNIGSLAVHGTVNDLAVSGAEPRYLSVNAIIEEGLELERLKRLISSLGTAATLCGVRVVAGDTKVVRRGEGSGLYLVTTGIGIRMRDYRPTLASIAPEDRLLVSGPIGDHGIAVLLAREQFGLKGDVASDGASVYPLTSLALPVRGLRFMRDPTRGGLATVAHDIVRATGYGIELFQGAVPVRPAVQSVCDMLGYDPAYLACEGRVVAVASAAAAEEVLARWRSHPQGKDSAIIGRVTDSDRYVTLRSDYGGARLLEELEDDPLPRIC